MQPKKPTKEDVREPDGRLRSKDLSKRFSKLMRASQDYDRSKNYSTGQIQVQSSNNMRSRISHNGLPKMGQRHTSRISILPDVKGLTEGKAGQLKTFTARSSSTGAPPR